MRGSGFGEGAFYRAVSLASGKEIGRLCLKMRVFRIFADGLAGVWVPLCGRRRKPRRSCLVRASSLWTLLRFTDLPQN